MTQRPGRIVHVISGLSTGGAEGMLARLIAALQRSGTAHEVVSLTTVGPVGAKLRAAGIEVAGLEMRSGVPDPRGLTRLVRLLRERRPALVQTWMYHADLLGGIAARLSGNIPVIWGVRQSDVGAEKPLLKFLARVTNPLLSRWLPDAIVCCGERARDVHVSFGFAPEKCTVIPNGFDLARFKPDPRAGAALRKELGIPEGAPLVGMVARLHPMKDHGNFMHAAAAVARELPSAVFLLCGDGLAPGARPLQRWMREAGLAPDSVRPIGRRDDMEKVYPALTVAVSSSKSGEGFSNVLGEAMACGVPCVATDVGDSALIVGETGRIVPPRDPSALARAVLEFLRIPASERAAAGLSARHRIETRYSLATIAARYEALYAQVLGRRSGEGRA